ncbi:hypothetical protein FA95DRAFT_1567101 [Auriscalpium vulgare]|uniref:Uncharacterized protein n=1 Tax=Auriscalpium vulgare TaxID=40419 RepID=A0ACB8R682_9AGAM|nr:hypothetical protein FA95DRAFT_1567101 [Auriscalpium vulgare]
MRHICAAHLRCCAPQRTRLSVGALGSAGFASDDAISFRRFGNWMCDLRFAVLTAFGRPWQSPAPPRRPHRRVGRALLHQQKNSAGQPGTRRGPEDCQICLATIPRGVAPHKLSLRTSGYL